MRNKEIPPPNRELVEAYINTIVGFENLESHQPALQQEVQTTDGSDQLTAFQVRGFRRDILMYQDQPRESNRLLRILRRLRSKHISKTVLFDTGIEKSLGLLYNHQNVQVREAARSLGKQWVSLYPDTERDASFCDFPKDLSSLRTNINHQIGLVRDMGRAIMALQTDSLLSSSASESSSGSSQEKRNDNVKSIIKNLGPICTETLASVEGEASTALSETNPSSGTGLPNTDFRALALDRLGGRLPPIEPVRSKEDFVSFVKSITGLDNRTIELLRYDLGVSYDGTAMNLNSACWTLAAKHTIRACSMITQENLSKKITALAKLEEQDGEHETASPASTREILLQDKANLERTLEKQKAELKEASEMHQEFLTDILIATILPLKFVIEEICGAKDKTRTLFSSDPKAGVRTIKNLETEITSVSSELVTAKKELAKAQSENNALRAQLDDSRQARAELKKSIANERSSMNNKYYKDIEARVEDRVRQDKTRLAEAETKSHQYDAVKTEYARLQDELQKAVGEIERLKVAKTDSDVRFADLKRKEQATQQGYEQMCERKHEADMRAVTLEAQLHALEEEMEETRESLGASGSSVTVVPSKEEAAERSQPTSSTIEIVKYNQQLNEADRLDMIARRWRNDLQSAVEQQETYREALKDTEAQIAAAVKQLEELQGPTTRGKQSKKSKKALKDIEAKIAVPVTNQDQEGIQEPATSGRGGSAPAADEVAPQSNASPPSPPQVSESPPATPQPEEIQRPSSPGLLHTSKKLKKFLEAARAQNTIISNQDREGGIQGPTTRGVHVEGSSSAAAQIQAETPATTIFGGDEGGDDVVLEPWMTMDKPDAWGAWADMDE